MQSVSSGQLIDILLNRNGVDDVVTMVRLRDKERSKDVATMDRLPDGIPQRTPEWYQARKGMLTASEFKTAGSDEVNADYVIGKVFPRPFPSNDAMRWGCRMEDLACRVYEILNSCKVREYGLLVHADAPWLGASPDGAVDESGVLIEIKAPYSRRIDRIQDRVDAAKPFSRGDRDALHARYLYQVLGQLEVCDLSFCDFTVAHIDEVDEGMFWQLRRVSDEPFRYAIVLDVEVDDEPKSVRYVTCDPNQDDVALSKWLAAEMSRDGRRIQKVWYSHVRELGVTRIPRDRKKWEGIFENLSRTKSAVDRMLESGQEMRTIDYDGTPSMFSHME